MFPVFGRIGLFISTLSSTELNPSYTSPKIISCAPIEVYCQSSSFGLLFLKQLDTLDAMKETTIAVQIETNRAHGRSMLEGIADYALAHTDWRLESIDPKMLSDLSHIERYDGFIVRVMDDLTADTLSKTAKPVIDTYGRSDSANTPFIRLDDHAIAECAARFFAEHRYIRCAFCGFPGLRFSEARGQAFKNAVCGLGGSCIMYDGTKKTLRESSVRNERMDECPDADALREWAKSLPKPVSVFCCNDMRAFQFMNVCADAKINVPREVSILGVDNDKVLCTFSNPPLSSIATDAFALGQTAAKMLSEMLSTPSRPLPIVTLHKPTGVIERTSTHFYHTETPWLSDALVYIRRHIGEGISANDVIAHLGYSHTTVGKVFRKELGISIQQEIIRYRRELACRLLKETSLTAAEIATDCGYPSPQYFAHMFSAHFGITPEKWRCGKQR